MVSRMLKKLAEKGGNYDRNIWGYYYFQTSSNAASAHEKIFRIRVSGDFSPRRKKYQGNDEEHFGRTSVRTFKP